MQLISDEGDDSIFGGDGNDEGSISAASEDVLYCGGDCDSVDVDGYGQRDELYCSGAETGIRSTRTTTHPAASKRRRDFEFVRDVLEGAQPDLPKVMMTRSEAYRSCVSSHGMNFRERQLHDIRFLA
jgi:hypothetical protein